MTKGQANTTEKLENKLNKKNLKTSQKSAKRARTKVPQKAKSKLLLVAIFMGVWVGLSVIASQLLIGMIMVGILGEEVFEQPAVTALYSVLCYALTLILTLSFFPKITKKWDKPDKSQKNLSKTTGSATKEKTIRNSLGLSGWPTWTDIGLCLVGFVAYLFLALVLTKIFEFFPWFDSGEAQEISFSRYLFGFDRLMAFLTLVILAPIVEEVLFRGWLYGKMRKTLSKEFTNALSMMISMFLTSLFFGIVHLKWNVGVNVFAMSIVLCGMREITGTIYAGMLTHMVKNGLAFYLIYVLGM